MFNLIKVAFKKNPVLAINVLFAIITGITSFAITTGFTLLTGLLKTIDTITGVGLVDLYTAIFHQLPQLVDISLKVQLIIHLV